MCFFIFFFFSCFPGEIPLCELGYTHKISRLPVPFRSGNSWIWVAPLRELQWNRKNSVRKPSFFPSFWLMRIHACAHRPCLTAHFRHQTFPPKSTQAVLASSLDIISHTIQHVLTTHSLLPHQHTAQQYANTTSFSRPLHMSTQLSLLGIENDLKSVEENSLEWFLPAIYSQCMQLWQELESRFSHKLDGVLIEVTKWKERERLICVFVAHDIDMNEQLHVLIAHTTCALYHSAYMVCSWGFPTKALSGMALILLLWKPLLYNIKT